jgi:transposase
MQGDKQQEQDDLFYYGTLDGLVPQDDPYRRLDGLLDLDWLRRDTRSLYAYGGRPSIDPIVIAKLLLIAYLQGITSERELMRQVQVNLAYRRFLHYSLSARLPDHSSLTRSRQRLGEVTVRRMFEYVLQLCIDAGLVGGDLETVDSTFVQANASLSSLRPRLVEVEAQRFTERIFRLNAVQDDDAEGHPLGEGASGRKTTRGRSKKPPAHEALVSRTDPEAALYHRRGKGTHVGYLVQYAVDSSNQVITGVLTTSAHERDTAQLLPLLDQVQRQGIAVKAVAADRGYSSGEVYQGLAERGIQSFIPQPQKGGEVYGHFGHDRFTYDPELDRYQCPQGAWLGRMKTRGPERRYKARKRDCHACPLKGQCTSGHVRTLNISPYQSELLAARELQATGAARKAARLRRVCSERTFAEAKERHGLRRAQQRGLGNMDIQALLTAAVINLKRYLKAVTRAFPAAAAGRAPARPTSVSRFRSCPCPA